MATFPCYIDTNQYINNSAASVELASLLGGNSILTGGPYAAGSMSLTLISGAGFVVQPSLAAPSSTNPVTAWILDGLNSETVQVTGVSSNTLTLASPGTTAIHANGVSVSSGGTFGCLADIIHQACREADNICQQGPDGVSEYDTGGLTDRSLFAVSRTESYVTPYGGAAFTVDNALVIWPYHFPVRSVSSISVQVGAMGTSSVSTTNMVLPNGGRSITIPYAQNITSAQVTPAFLNMPFSRVAESYVTLVYTAGPIAGATLATVPIDITRAVMLLTSDILASRSNPLGAANVHKGDTSHMFELRGDTAGKSLNWKDAAHRLRPYTRQQ